MITIYRQAIDIFNLLFEVADDLIPCQRPVRWNRIEPCPCDNCLKARNLGRIAGNIVDKAKRVQYEQECLAVGRKP